ncbi:MAG TPA: DUF488 domain-containing protein [Thermoanaerobaculia bacterium]|nr:DUF488 domain-containing protein [Thermoanaerobaculia bacterium]
MASALIWTIGHSNHSLEAFLAILNAHAIERVIDVRRFPASRRWPHFNAASFSTTLPAAGIDYTGMPELGGRRKARPDSPHAAWRVEAFRGYADFMDTKEFEEAFGRAAGLAREKRSAVMCAESLPWRCHRSLLADAFLARGWSVFEILSEKEDRPRRLPAFARFEGTRVIYDVLTTGILDLGR